MLGTSSGVRELEGSNGSPGQSSSVACVADFCGPSDLPNFFKSRAVGSQGAISSLLGGTVEEKRAEAIAASPVAHVTKDAPPFLIMHGTEDDIVPYTQAETLYATLKKAGVDVTLVKLEGAGHFFLGGEVDRRVTAFFDKHLRGRDVTISSAPIRAGGFSARFPGER
jgi:dipeptidyl aminopeptidase/acylaminoacyl peptidase